MTRLAAAILRQGSLGRRILVISLAQVLVLVVALVLFLRLTLVTQAAVEEATLTYVEEQAIADRVTSAVTRQLVTAAASVTDPDAWLLDDFADAGDVAHAEIRRYLFRDLSGGQRLQLETIRESHQRMEVAAAEGLELARRGDQPGARAASAEMISHGLTLQAALSEFLRLREEDLHRLSSHQAAVFRYLQYGAAAGALVMLAIMGLLGRSLYRGLATPLTDLTDAAERIGTGDLDARVAPPKEVELAVVASAFNQMTGRLAGARRELEHRNRELETTLEQLREAQAEVIQTEKLSAMGRMMAGLAHELNNPLTSVLGYGQLALEQAEDEAQADAGALIADYVEPIVAEATRARELVDTLLGFARRSDGVVGTASLREAVARAVRIRAYAYEQAGLELRVDELPDVRVQADEQRLLQSVLNLINNAYDAMAPRGRGTLVIAARTDGDQVVLTFDDDGPGIAALDRVFEPFYTTKPVGEGTGLGLPLVHRFMEEVGGSIAAAERPGGGARFVLTLRAAGEGAPADDAPADDAPAEGAPASAAATATPPLPRGGDAGRPRILVVEDEPPVRELQRRLLARLGATVLMAEHGARAREILEAEEVDLVISDVKMPGGSGAELFRWVQEARPHLAHRFLFVTGAASDEETARLAEERPDLFINKPFEMAEYVAFVAARLGAPAAPAGGQRP